MAGARSPRGLSVGFPCVPCYDRGKTYINNAALLGRTLAGGRAGPPDPRPPPNPQRKGHPPPRVVNFIA